MDPASSLARLRSPPAAYSGLSAASSPHLTPVKITTRGLELSSSSFPGSNEGLSPRVSKRSRSQSSAVRSSVRGGVGLLVVARIRPSMGQLGISYGMHGRPASPSVSSLNGFIGGNDRDDATVLPSGCMSADEELNGVGEAITFPEDGRTVIVAIPSTRKEREQSLGLAADPGNPSRGSTSNPSTPRTRRAASSAPSPYSRPSSRNRQRSDSTSSSASSTSVPPSSSSDVPSTRQEFKFHHVYPPSTGQPEIFEDVAMDSVRDLLLGYNSTIFAYGQTSGGKTYTMVGPDRLWSKGQRTSLTDQDGIAPRCCEFLFRELEATDDIAEVSVKVSFIEVYLESLRDLLSGDSQLEDMKIREYPTGEVFLHGAQERLVHCAGDIMELIRKGQKSRTTSATQMNRTSSRSHALLTVYVDQKLKDGTVRSGKMHLADLAGSERVKESKSSGLTLSEARKINLSLSCLGNVITALSKENVSHAHVPYRNSKLTYLLRDSLGGNCKTSVIVCCAPELRNLNATVTTLKFATRALGVRNRPVVNKKMSRTQLLALVTALRQEINMYKEQAALSSGRQTPTFSSLSPSPFAPPEMSHMDLQRTGSGGNSSYPSTTTATVPSRGQSPVSVPLSPQHARSTQVSSPKLTYNFASVDFGNTIPGPGSVRARAASPSPGQAKAKASLVQIDSLKAEKQRLLTLLTDHLERESYSMAQDWPAQESASPAPATASRGGSNGKHITSREGLEQRNKKKSLTQEERDLLEFQREEARIQEMLTKLGSMGSAPSLQEQSNRKAVRSTTSQLPSSRPSPSSSPSPFPVRSPPPVVLSAVHNGGRMRSPSPGRRLKVNLPVTSSSPPSSSSSLSTRRGGRASPQPIRARVPSPIVVSNTVPSHNTSVQSDRDQEIAAFREEEARLLALYSPAASSKQKAPSPASHRN